MISAIRAVVAISFINTAFIILFVSFTSSFNSQAQNSPPLTLQISTPQPTPSSPPILTPTHNSTLSPVPTVISTPIPALPTPDTRCLIQVRGQVFDITQFRNLHSGGDIFQCGTDMTAVFNSQHNDSTFGTLQKYKI